MAYAVSSPPQETPASARISCDRSRPIKDRRLHGCSRRHVASTLFRQDAACMPCSRRAAALHLRFTTRHEKCPSALSSCLRTPAPPVSAATTAHCLAGRSPEFPADFRRRFPRLLLRPLSLSTAFEARDGPSHAPGTSPAAAEIPALVLFFVSQVTSLSGMSRRKDGCVPGSSEPDTVCAGCHTKRLTGDFGGPNGEASPYPSASLVRGSAPSLAKLTGKPSRAFHG